MVLSSAEKSAEHKRGNARGRSLRVHHVHEQAAEQHWYRDATRGDHHRCAGALFQLAHVELQPDQKHVEDHADLRDRAQIRDNGRGQQEGRDVGCIEPQERRAQDDAREHLSDNWRLPDAAEQLAYELCEQDDDQKCDQQVQERAVVRGRRTFGLSLH
jgi:hypothetical protein